MGIFLLSAKWLQRFPRITDIFSYVAGQLCPRFMEVGRGVLVCPSRRGRLPDPYWRPRFFSPENEGGESCRPPAILSQGDDAEPGSRQEEPPRKDLQEQAGHPIQPGRHRPDSEARAARPGGPAGGGRPLFLEREFQPCGLPRRGSGISPRLRICCAVWRMALRLPSSTRPY